MAPLCLSRLLILELFQPPHHYTIIRYFEDSVPTICKFVQTMTHLLVKTWQLFLIAQTSFKGPKIVINDWKFSFSVKFFGFSSKFLELDMGSHCLRFCTAERRPGREHLLKFPEFSIFSKLDSNPRKLENIAQGSSF